MNIKKETTVICGNKEKKQMRINIPAIIRDIMDLKGGEKLICLMETENEIIIRKKQD